MIIKAKIENNDKLYEINISDNKQLTISQQTQTFLDNINFEIPDNRIFYALFNTDSNMYMISYDEISNFKNSTFIIKNCSLEAKNIVSILQNIYNESIGFRSESSNNHSFGKSTDLTPGSLASSEYLETGGSRSSVSANARPGLKNIVFKLKNYFFVDAFSEEFIAYDGIRVLINLIDNTSGNTRSYAINALKSLLRYENSYGYIQENKEVVEILYNILINYDAMNTATHTLDVLILITNILSDFGVSIIMRSAEIYAMRSNNKIFKELVNFINDSNIDIKLNSLNLICDMLEKCTDKIKKSKLLVALEDVELKAILEKNSDCRSRDFQNFLTKYQLLTGEIIRGSFYEVETYKKKLRELEKHCNELERKTELIFLNQKFNNEIVEDFIHFKKLAEVCSDVGGYYDPYSPVDRYDHRLNRKINVDPNGILNMKKLTEDIRKEDIPRVKTLQNELDSLTTRYKNLKEDFDLINLNNKELKNIFYDKTGKKDSSDNDYSRTKEMEDLKGENKELQKKMDIMVDKLKKITDENKENEEDIERLKKEIKKYKENSSNRNSFHSDLVPIPCEHIEFTGQKVENNQASLIQKSTIPGIPCIPPTIPPKPPTTIQVPNVPSIPTNPGAPKVPVPPKIPTILPTTVPPVPGIPVPKVPGLPSVPSVPGVPKVAGPPSVPIPGVPSVAKVPGPPTVPSVPKVPGPPTVPSVPGVPVPKAPGPPSIPGVPKVPGVPGVPSVPGVPGVPNVPGVPGVPGVPKAPGVPSVPGVPKAPGVPSVPGVPKAPGVPGVPKAPGVPGVPGVPKAPGVPGIPGVPKAPGVPGVPSAPGIPKAPGVPGVPSAPGVPGIPKAPGAPGVPSAPGVPGVPKAPGTQGNPVVPNTEAPVAQQPQPVVFKPVVTKKEIKLEKKVKGVTWNRILLMPKEAPNRVETVWDNIKEVKTAAPIVNKDDSSKPPEIKKKKFLNDKRSQSVGIGLAKCPAIDRIETALKNMDLDLLPKQLVLNLNREYLTEEEIGMYEAMNSLPGDWEKQEDLLIKIRNIDSSKEKLQIWSFFFEVEDQIDNIESLVSSYREAFKKVRESDPLKKIISYILSVGNILNGGTPKGQADGFNLDILTKLTTVKDNSNKTFLQIICMKIKSEDEDFKPMKKSFGCIEDSLKVPSMETKGTLDKYLKEAEGNKVILDKFSTKDSFYDKAGKTLDSYISRIKKLDEEYKSNLEYAQKTVEYFGYPKSDAKYKKPDDFLLLIKDFLGDLDKSIPVTEAKKAFKGAAEMGKKITDNKNPAFNSVLSGLKSKLGNNN